MHILGLSAMGHDPAAALIDEHGVVAAIEESKLERARSTAGIPRAAIRFCLDRAGIGWRDLERVAVASRPPSASFRKTALRLRLAPRAPLSSGYFFNKALGELGRELNNFRILRESAGEPSSRVAGLDHHLCHASSAYFASPYDAALVVVLDEQGDGRSGLVALGEGSRLRPLSTLAFPHSLAWVFTQVTRLLGFRPHADEHKTQWLSLAGEPAFLPLFLEMLRRAPGGPPRLNGKYFRRELAGELSFSDAFYRQIGVPRESWKQASAPAMDDSLRANLAASLQQACGAVVCAWLESWRKETQTRKLCLAGGLFLNALLVAAVEKNTGFDEVFVQPAAGNEGTALGAAWLAWHHAPQRPRLAPLSSLYCGPSYTNEEIKAVLDNCKASYRWCDSEDHKIEQAVQLLESGKIVAWYQGAAEFGPRALGHRSLLASPWADYVPENLNDYVKHRESFRPFALAIPEEHCAEYFDCSKNGCFMATMAAAREKARRLFPSPSSFISAGGLTRLHVVAAADNPLLWKLLKRSGATRPAPILVNTSFNLFGEPLVVTPRDAVRSYYCSGTDALVAGSFLLAKR